MAQKEKSFFLCYPHVIYYDRSSWWIRIQKQIPTSVLLCKVKIFQDLQITWCLFDALLFKNKRRKKTGKERKSKGFQTKQCLKKALLKHFHFHQNGNVNLIDGVMLMQCWQDQNETQSVEWDLLQAFTLFFCFQLLTCSLLAQKIENAQFKSIYILTLTCISEIDIFTSSFELKYLLFCSPTLMSVMPHHLQKVTKVVKLD